MLKTSNHWLSRTQIDYVPPSVWQPTHLHNNHKNHNNHNGNNNHTEVDMVPKTATLLLFGILLTTRGGAIVAPPDVISGAVHSSKGRNAEEARNQDQRHHFISHSFQHGPIRGAFQLTPLELQDDWLIAGPNVAQLQNSFAQPAGSLFTHQLAAPGHQTNTVIIKGRDHETPRSAAEDSPQPRPSVMTNIPQQRPQPLLNDPQFVQPPLLSHQFNGLSNANTPPPSPPPPPPRQFFVIGNRPPTNFAPPQASQLDPGRPVSRMFPVPDRTSLMMNQNLPPTGQNAYQGMPQQMHAQAPPPQYVPAGVMGVPGGGFVQPGYNLVPEGAVLYQGPQGQQQAQNFPFPDQFSPQSIPGPYQPPPPPPPFPLPPPPTQQQYQQTQEFHGEQPQNAVEQWNRPRPVIITYHHPEVDQRPQQHDGKPQAEANKPSKQPHGHPADHKPTPGHDANKPPQQTQGAHATKHTASGQDAEEALKAASNASTPHAAAANATKAANATDATTKGRAAYGTTLTGIGPLGAYGASTGGVGGVGLGGRPFLASHGNVHGAGLLGSYGGSHGGLHGVGVLGRPYGASHGALNGASLLGAYGLRTGGVHGGPLSLHPMAPGVFRRFRSVGDGDHGYFPQQAPAYLQANAGGPVACDEHAVYMTRHPVPSPPRQREYHPVGQAPPPHAQQTFPPPPPYVQKNHPPPGVAPPNYLQTHALPPTQYQARPQFDPSQQPPMVPPSPPNGPYQPSVNLPVAHRPTGAHTAHLHDYPYNFGEKDSKYDSKARASVSAGLLPTIDKLLGGYGYAMQPGYAVGQSYGGGGSGIGGSNSGGSGSGSGVVGDPNDPGRQNSGVVQQSRPSAPPLATLERLTNQRLDLTRDLLLRPLAAPLSGLSALLKASALGLNAGGELTKKQGTGNYKVLTGYNSHMYDHKGQDYGYGQPPPWIGYGQQAVPYQPQYPTAYGATPTEVKVEPKVDGPVSLGDLRKGVHGVGRPGEAHIAGGVVQRPDEHKQGGYGQGLALPYHQVHRDSGFDVKETTVGGEVVNLADKSLSVGGHLGQKH